MQIKKLMVWHIAGWTWTKQRKIVKLLLQWLLVIIGCTSIFDINGDMENHTIAPLLLVPFFENICKHAVLTDTPDPVKIKLAIKNGTLYFSCRNKTWQAEKDTIGGVGWSAKR